MRDCNHKNEFSHCSECCDEERAEFERQEGYWHKTAQGLGIAAFDLKSRLAAAVALLKEIDPVFDVDLHQRVTEFLK